jgi:hypothetical protein
MVVTILAGHSARDRRWPNEKPGPDGAAPSAIKCRARASGRRFCVGFSHVGHAQRLMASGKISWLAQIASRVVDEQTSML